MTALLGQWLQKIHSFVEQAARSVSSNLCRGSLWNCKTLFTVAESPRSPACKCVTHCRVSGMCPVASASKPVKKFQAAQRIADFVSQHRGYLRQSMRPARGFSLARNSLLLGHIAKN